LGPLLLGRLFDTIGRRQMIAATFGISGVLIAASGYLFAIGLLNSATQSSSWSIILFLASAASSAAGGIIGPLLFGVLISSGSR
jgi:MFS family permease